MGTGNQLLTARDVAEWLAVSRKSVFRWAEEGRLASVRLGDRTIRFEANAVLTFIASQRDSSGGGVLG